MTPFFDNLPRTVRWVQTDPRKVWASDRRLGGAGLQGEQLSRFFQARVHPHAHRLHTQPTTSLTWGLQPGCVG